MKTIHLKLFASLREHIGYAHKILTIPQSIQSMKELIDYLQHQDEIWVNVFKEHHNIRFAVNQHVAHSETLIENEAEIALFPPVTGG